MKMQASAIIAECEQRLNQVWLHSKPKTTRLLCVHVEAQQFYAKYHVSIYMISQ